MSVVYWYLNEEDRKRQFSKMNGVHCVSLPAPSLSHLMYAMEVFNIDI